VLVILQLNFIQRTGGLGAETIKRFHYKSDSALNADVSGRYVCTIYIFIAPYSAKIAATGLGISPYSRRAMYIHAMSTYIFGGFFSPPQVRSGAVAHAIDLGTI
jgi:hypothetical protein